MDQASIAHQLRLDIRRGVEIDPPGLTELVGVGLRMARTRSGRTGHWIVRRLYKPSHGDKIADIQDRGVHVALCGQKLDTIYNSSRTIERALQARINESMCRWWKENRGKRFPGWTECLGCRSRLAIAWIQQAESR